MRNFLFILLALGILSPLQAQDDSNNIPVGTWRLHAPYLYSLHLAINTSDGRVYSCSPEGLLYADPDGTAHGLTTLDGLASTQFSTLAYDATTQSILIAYADGNLDVLRGNSLTNVNDIVRSTTIVGSKSINHILVNNGKAYLSADFGVSVLNLRTLNIEETWKNLSTGSMENPILGATLTSDLDSIFLASQDGVLAGKLAPGINLMDFNNWKLFGTSDGLPATGLVAAGSYNGTVYAGYTQNGVYALSGTQWILTSAPVNASTELRGMRNTSTGVLVSAGGFVVNISSPTAFTYIVPTGTWLQPADCDIDPRGNVWVADKGTGLWIKVPTGYVPYTLNGPAHNRHFKLHYKANNMISCAGGYEKVNHQGAFSDDGYYEFVQNDEWKNYSYFYMGLSSRDLVDAEYSTDGRLYLGSYRQGLYVRAADGSYTLLDYSNSNLKETGTGSGETRVSGLAMDSRNNLWISNVSYPINTTIHKLSPAGVWTSYTPTDASGSFPLEITIDGKDNKWIILTGIDGQGDGIMVFNENSTPRERYLDKNAGSGGLPSKSVYTLAIDHNGHLWAGTSAGVTVLYNAATYLSSPKDFTQPFYNGFPLLFDRVVYDIVIDGGNRKWIGTDNGIWLMNEDCSRIITTFNTDNSPLISNYILDMELNALTGELFIATDKGLMSFRSDATASAKDYSNVKVFPNPVKPGFSGYVTVSGLVENSTVKITDITGQLVFQDQSNGGTVSWNLYDYSGKKARAGVYIVFLSDEEGNQTQIAQFAVVE